VEPDDLAEVYDVGVVWGCVVLLVSDNLGSD